MKIRRLIECFAISIFVIASITSALHAQGTLSGNATDANGAPLPGVTVRAVPTSDSTTPRYTFTNSVGKYRFSKLASSSYRVTFSLLGFLDKNYTVDINEAQPATLNAELAEQPLKSQEVVVTSSRHEEKELHSPASISVVSAQEIRDHVNPTPTEALKNVPGMDVAQEGIAYSTYATRSFHSVYGTDVLTMQDYHSLELPALAVFYGILMPQNMDDIDHIEVIRGPGSALYGPDAATGVVNFISKSPFASQGTNISISGGERDYINAGFRHDEAISDKFAFTLSGNYLKANDWALADDPKEDTARKYAQLALLAPGITSTQKDSLSRIGNRDYSLETYSFNARMDAILADDLTANVSAGLADISNGAAMTEDFGDAQIKNWTYDFVQARVNYQDLFIQASYNHDNTSSSSGSYFLPTGAPIIDHSSTYVAQIQHHWDPMSNEKLTYGADYKSIVPLSENTIYGPDDGHANTQIYGAYLQSQTSLLDNQLEIVLAVRVDKDANQASDIAPIFSPRAAAVYHIDENNLVRAMYNSTYLLPTEVDLFSDLLYTKDAFGFAAQGLPFAPVDIRYVSPYVSGLNFVPVTGGFNMYTTFAPGTAIPSGYAVNALWPVLDSLVVHGLQAKKLFVDSIAANIFSKLSAPTPQQVLTYLAYLNLHPSATSPYPFLPAANNQPLNITPVQPQHQRTFELDYQGAVSKSFQFEIDAYQTYYDAIRASTVALTPNVFADPASLTTYLIDSLTPKIGAANATALADSVVKTLAATPLGVVQPSGSPTGESYPDDVLIGTRSYLVNTISFYGIDFFSTYKANEDWSFDESFSFMNKNYWYASELNPTDSTNQNPFALNMPKYRASLGVKYSGLARGLALELRDRWSDGFKMYDNYWVGDVNARHVLDLTVNYRIEALNNLQLTLSVTNLLDNQHQEFVGAPLIGRITILRASYALPSL
jgi:outer membrane receptor for ferrienterochelin and colicins